MSQQWYESQNIFNGSFMPDHDQWINSQHVPYTADEAGPSGTDFDQNMGEVPLVFSQPRQVPVVAKQSHCLDSGHAYQNNGDTLNPAAGNEETTTTDGSGHNLKRGIFCRKRKLKCSGERPKCTSCIKYSKECEYAPPAKLAKFKALENRISELSDYIRQGENVTTRASTPIKQATNSLLVPDTAPVVNREFPELPAAASSMAVVPDCDAVPSSLLQYGPPIPPEPALPSLQTQTGAQHAAPGFPPESFLGFDYSSTNSFGQPQPQYPPPEAPFTMQLQEAFSPFSGSQVDHLSQFREQQSRLYASIMAGEAPNGVSVARPATTTTYEPSVNHGLFDMGLPNEIPPSLSLRPYPSSNPASTPRNGYNQFSATTPVNTPEDPDRERINAQQKAAALKFLRTARQASIPKTSPASSTGTAAATPDAMIGLPLNATVDTSSSAQYGRQLPHHGLLNGSTEPIDDDWTREQHKMMPGYIDPIDGLTESLGEFLFNPKTATAPDAAHSSAQGMGNGHLGNKKRRGTTTSSDLRAKDGSLIVVESDGLTDAARETLLDCFLAHSRLFFEMSIPRFRYRMTLTDKRRPAPALLYAMYLWATRMTHSPRVSPMEAHFFDASCKALDLSSVNADRLIDCMRAALLLSAYSYTSGRYHEGWVLSGLAVRLILSSGLHQIRSCVFSPEPPRDPLLRGKTFLLGPPEDATDLAERIATFWGILATERGGALATGFPCGIADADITTPFPRAFGDVASRTVTQHDDLTVRDLYRRSYFPSDEGLPFAKWMKATMILERASKLAFIDPDEDSEYSRAWSIYFQQSPHNPRLSNPPAWLDQPKYRCPKDYSETKLAVDQLRDNMGVEGVNPVDMRRNALLDGAEEPVITAHTIKLHHTFAAIYMFLHDINANGVENKEALIGARRSVALMRDLPPMSYMDVDPFTVTVWSIIAKCLIKELQRVNSVNDAQGVIDVTADIDVYIVAMQQVASAMPLARSQALALMELKKHAMNVRTEVPKEEELSRRKSRKT